MNRHPKFQQERIRLKLRLEDQKSLIQQDLYELKESVKPLALVKGVIKDAASSFRDNSFATQGTRLALSMLPFRLLRNPVLGIAAQIAVPLLVRNLPLVAGFVRDKTPKVSKSRILGAMKKTVKRLRAKL